MFKAGEVYKNRSGIFSYEYLGPVADDRAAFRFLESDLNPKAIILKYKNGKTIDGNNIFDVMPNIKKESIWVVVFKTIQNREYFNSVSAAVRWKNDNKGSYPAWILRYDFEDDKLVKVEIENV